MLATHTYIEMFQHDIPDTSDVVLASHTYILNVSTYSRHKRCQVDYPYLYYIRFKIILLTQKMSCWLPILTLKCFNRIFLTSDVMLASHTYLFQHDIPDTSDVVLASYILTLKCFSMIFLTQVISCQLPILTLKCFNRIFLTSDVMLASHTYLFQHDIPDTSDIVLAFYTYIKMLQHDIPETSDVMLASHTYIKMFQHDIPDTSNVVLASHTYIKMFRHNTSDICWLLILTLKCFNMIFLTQVMSCLLLTKLSSSSKTVFRAN